MMSKTEEKEIHFFNTTSKEQWLGIIIAVSSMVVIALIGSTLLPSSAFLFGPAALFVFAGAVAREHFMKPSSVRVGRDGVTLSFRSHPSQFLSYESIDHIWMATWKNGSILNGKKFGGRLHPRRGISHTLTYEIAEAIAATRRVRVRIGMNFKEIIWQ